MSGGLDLLLDRLAVPTVLVIGEAMLDTYFEGAGGRICREAPVPIVTLTGRLDAPGAAANVAANLAALGAQAVLVSVVGDDVEGQRLTHALRQRHVSTNLVLADRTRVTLAKQRVVADGQLLVRFDQGSTAPLAPAAERAVLQALERWYPRADAVVVSDYGYGILSPSVIARLGALQARYHRTLIVDAKTLPAYHDAGVTVAKPNYEEAAQLLGQTLVPGTTHRAEAIMSSGTELHELTGAQVVVVTLDAEGAVALERGRSPYRAYARANRHARCAGAGDTFAAALALALAAGADTPAATDLASAAAAVVVSKDGTAVCSDSELRRAVAGDSKCLPGIRELRDRVAAHRRAGRRVVLTNGCFDILHRGHVAYLSRAKSLGDILVVAVNTDDGVHRIKGPSRPVNPLDDRVAVLAALSCVDHIVGFDEDTPEAVIRAVRPDVFVKGGDYTRERLPEASLVEELGGSVVILPFLSDRSTTSIIRRIRDTDRPAGTERRAAV